VLTDLRLPDVDGMEVLQASREAQREVPVILITAFGTIETAIQAIRQGAYDFVTKPFALDEISLLVGKAWEARRLREENRRLREEVAGRYRLHNLLGRSVGHAERVRPHPTGGPRRRQCPDHGGERYGEGIGGQSSSLNSQRADRPFVPINCARCRPACWKASSSVMSRAPSPAP